MHKARKRFGQNFLQDGSVIDRIISSINIKAPQNLVEIGPGQGALTQGLLDNNNSHLDVIELDRDLIPILKTKFFNHEGLTIHEGDALEFDFTTLNKTPLRVAGNLPYNISTPLIFHLLEHVDIIEDMHFMLQKEVVQRLCADVGNGHYGRLTVMVQYYCQTEFLFIVGPEAFDPAPKVDSAIVRLTPKKEYPVKALDIAVLESTVRQSFAMRRKTLRNNLKNIVSTEELESIGIDPTLRPERIEVNQFVKIANFIVERNQ